MSLTKQDIDDYFNRFIMPSFERWVASLVRCCNCRYVWAAVYPESSKSLDCPHCSKETAIRLAKKHHVRAYKRRMNGSL